MSKKTVMSLALVRETRKDPTERPSWALRAEDVIEDATRRHGLDASERDIVEREPPAGDGADGTREG